MPTSRLGRAARGRRQLLQRQCGSRLVLTILFSYSIFPLELAAIGGSSWRRQLRAGPATSSTGWSREHSRAGLETIVVLPAVFNGFTIALLSMLGSYVVRTLNAVSAQETYHVVAKVSG